MHLYYSIYRVGGEGQGHCGPTVLYLELHPQTFFCLYLEAGSQAAQAGLELAASCLSLASCWDCRCGHQFMRSLSCVLDSVFSVLGSCFVDLVFGLSEVFVSAEVCRRPASELGLLSLGLGLVPFPRRYPVGVAVFGCYWPPPCPCFALVCAFWTVRGSAGPQSSFPVIAWLDRACLLVKSSGRA